MEWSFHIAHATSNRTADRLSGHVHLRLLPCLMLLALAASTTMTRLAPVPPDLQDEARPDGVPAVRSYPQPFSDPSAHLQGSTLWGASTGGAEIPVSLSILSSHIANATYGVDYKTRDERILTTPVSQKTRS